jgi:hypothetical protein
MKKILIILSLILIFNIASAEITNWSDIAFRNFTSDDNTNYGFGWKHEIEKNINSNLTINFKNELFYSQKNDDFPNDYSHDSEMRNSYFTNYSKLKMLYNIDEHYLKLQYSNRWFNSNDTRFLVTSGVGDKTQKSMIHNVDLRYIADLKKLQFSYYGKFRNLNYKHIDIADIIQDEFDNDLFNYADLFFVINDEIKLFTSIYYKNDLNESNLYDQTNLGGGFEYDNKINLFSSVKAKVYYYNSISDRINNEQDHNLVTQLRYSRRFRNGVSGFISYINRSCYDNETSQVYRVSNMLRVHAMYSYSLENLNNSYLLAGVKLNPENEGTLGFMEHNQYLFKDIYSTANIKYSLDLFTSYSLKFEYFLNSLQSFWIKDEYTDFYDIQKQNLIFIGSTLIF